MMMIHGDLIVKPAFLMEYTGSYTRPAFFIQSTSFTFISSWFLKTQNITCVLDNNNWNCKVFEFKKRKNQQVQDQQNSASDL